MKKLISRNHIAFAAAGMILASALPVFPAAAADAPSVLILGDSISSGDGLKAGECGYYDYVADCTGDTLTNLAKSGSTTSDVIAVIDDAANKDTIADADIICISAGGNDLMQPAKAYFETLAKEGENLIDTAKRIVKEGDRVSMLLAVNGKIKPSRKEAQANYIKIVEKLREMNPDAQIIFETLYNPFEISPDAVKARGYSDEDYGYLKNIINSHEDYLNNVMRAIAGVPLKRELGDTIKVNEVEVEKAEGVKVADVETAFEENGWLYNRILEKDIHPTPLGHALIAATVLDQIGDTNIQSAALAETVANLKQSVFTQIPADDYSVISKYAVGVQYLKGDFDNSGQVSIEDVQDLLRVYTNGVSGKKIEDNVTARQFVTGDVNGDGSISIDDVQYLLIYYVKRNVSHANVDWDDILPKK